MLSDVPAAVGACAAWSWWHCLDCTQGAVEMQHIILGILSLLLATLNCMTARALGLISLRPSLAEGDFELSSQSVVPAIFVAAAKGMKQNTRFHDATVNEPFSCKRNA